MGMILRKSNENEIEKIVEISKKSFDTDIRIFINPQHFGQGYGIQLMRDIECCFPDVYVIQLDTPIWNVRTNRFYRKCGYKQTGKDIESVYYEKRKNKDSLYDL